MQVLTPVRLSRPYETDRILLRPLTEDDLNEAFLEWFQDDDLMRFYTNSK